MREHWAFLAAVITNGLNGIASMFSKRKPKRISPDDFINKDYKKSVEDIVEGITKEAQPESKKTDWASHVKDAMGKGLKGPW